MPFNGHPPRQIHEVAVNSSMIWFLLAAVGELVGCYALWVWLRRQGSPLLVALAVASLLFFAWCLTKTPVQVAGRAFAAYAGVYLVAALAWMVMIDRERPDRWDVLGGALALLGALVIVYGPRSSSGGEGAALREGGW